MLPDIPPVNKHVGNGVTVNFPFDFKVFEQGDLRVQIGEVVQPYGTVYSATGFGADGGGTVSFVFPPVSLADITIYREVTPEREIDYQYQGDFLSPVVNLDFDRIWMAIQEAYQQIDRSLRLSITQVGLSTTIPNPIANNLIGWNSAAIGLQNIDPAGFANIITYGNWSYQVFSGNGVQTDFVLDTDPVSAANVDLTVGGVPQRTALDYNIVALKTIRILPAPPVGINNVFFRWGSALPLGVATAIAGQTTIGTQLIQAATAAAALTVVGGYPLTGGRLNGSMELPPGGTLSFEGSTEDAFETFITATNPTADRTITFPDKSGTAAMISDIPIPATAAQIRTGTDNVASVTSLGILTALGVSNHYSSGALTITSAGAITLSHGMARRPLIMIMFITCVTADLGYSAGDIVMVNGQTSSSANDSYGVQLNPTASQILGRFGAQTGLFVILNKTTGTAGNAANANWTLSIEAFA